MRYTKTTLQNLEEVFKTLGYIIRYEKGNFQSGFCLVQDKKIIVINKFFEMEARINALVEILNTIDFQVSQFDERLQKFLKNIGYENINISQKGFLIKI